MRTYREDELFEENKRLREALEIIEDNCPCSKAKKVAEQALKEKNDV